MKEFNDKNDGGDRSHDRNTVDGTTAVVTIAETINNKNIENNMSNHDNKKTTNNRVLAFCIFYYYLVGYVP